MASVVIVKCSYGVGFRDDSLDLCVRGGGRECGFLLLHFLDPRDSEESVDVDCQHDTHRSKLYKRGRCVNGQ